MRVRFSLESPLNTKQIGATSEAKILAACLARGWVVSLPFGNMSRYDMIVDVGVKLLKVQCKTGHLKNGLIQFDTVSTNPSTYEKLDYALDADILAVYSEFNNQVYWIPVNEIKTDRLFLRIDPPKNNQAKYVKWAKNYEFTPVVQR